MTTLHGEILPYLEAIGSEDGSEAMIAAMEKVGTTFVLEEFTSTGVHERYLEFRKGGVSFLVIDGILDTVFFHLVQEGDNMPHPRPDTLIEGLVPDMPTSELPAVLGEPVHAGPTRMVYRVGDKILVLDVEGGRLVTFCVQLHALGDYSEPSETIPARPITGEVSLFLDAAGSSVDSEAMARVVQAVGPGSTSHEIDDGKGARKLQMFTDDGVDVQSRDGLVDGVLIFTTDEERSAYPRLEALVDGLTFPATRTDVTAALGTAKTSLDDLDLYTAQGRYVMFNYTGDRLTTVSIAHVAEGAIA